jgi:hypothetical protein
MSARNLFKVAEKLEKKYLASEAQMQEGFGTGLDDVSKVTNSFRLLTELVTMIQRFKDRLKTYPVAEVPATNILTGYNAIRTMMQRAWNPSIQGYDLDNTKIVNIKRFLSSVLEDVGQVIPVLKSIAPDQSGKLDQYLNSLNSNISQIKAG